MFTNGINPDPVRIEVGPASRSRHWIKIQSPLMLEIYEVDVNHHILSTLLPDEQPIILIASLGFRNLF